MRQWGVTAIILNPELTDEPEMPRTAVEVAGADHVLLAADIGAIISQMAQRSVQTE